jgi:hypothetical protein
LTDPDAMRTAETQSHAWTPTRPIVCWLTMWSVSEGESEWGWSTKRKVCRSAAGNRGEGFPNPDPHHIWHNCEVHTASAWPGRHDMLFGGRHFRFSHLTDRHPEGLAAVEIFR